MKLITLNTWGGRAGKEALLQFFSKYSDTDVFCLQEIWNGGEEMLGEKAGGSKLVGVETTIYEDIAKVLPDHAAYFRPQFRDYYGLALFVRKSTKVRKEDEIFVYKEKGFISVEENGNHARNLQYAELSREGHELTIAHVHGLWNGKGKDDCEERLVQSDKIAEFVQSQKQPLVLAGDFNLLPDTESVRKIESAGLRNLVTEFGVTSTRTSYYDRPIRFADYVFVSQGVDVTDFKVLPEEVSDHAALYVEFQTT